MTPPPRSLRIRATRATLAAVAERALGKPVVHIECREVEWRVDPLRVPPTRERPVRQRVLGEFASPGE